MSLGMLGLACLRAGQLDEAQQSLERALEQGFNRSFASNYLGLLSEVHRQRGDLEVARVEADRAVDLSTEQGMIGMQALARLQRARVAVSAGGASDLGFAREEIDRAEALATERGLADRLADVEALRAEMAVRAGDEVEFARARDEAIRIYQSCGDLRQVARLKGLGADG
jgi:tetratricopeptide (TPR) repeat protein